ncbi:MAG TPA: SgcJ/EcaC family oxidoreductase [Pyrinomonadaceae bacterium]|jgi:uncharacterized protein (TIGR02246 family)
MLKNLFIVNMSVIVFASIAVAQNANSGTTTPQRRPTAPTRRPPTPAPTATPDADAQPTPTPAAEPASTTRTRRASTPARAAATAAEQEVRATFDALLRAVEKRDVDAVMNFYWNSPQLLIYNNNGTVTRGWAQVRANTESLYADLRDVKIEARDVRVQALGADAAVITCLWTQTQIYKGTPETSAGRMTLLLRHAAGAWKIAHRHTSPDAPAPARLPASEQVAPPPAATPTRPPAPEL